MIDIGVNLLHEQFAADRAEVLERAWQAGLEHLVITGTDLDNSAAAADYVAASGDPRLSTTVGIHPHDARNAPPGWAEALRRLAERPGVVAIGETGLDFNRDFSPRRVQEQLLCEQLTLAAELALPAFVHDREAGEQVARCLRDCADFDAGVVVHCFTGTAADLARYLELGCWIGITGWVCDRRRGEALRRLVPTIPLDRLLVETDAPFLRPHNAPRDRHGRRNEPALLPFVVRQIAELYAMDEQRIGEITAANARRFFRLG